jgi:hypothetical protein
MLSAYVLIETQVGKVAHVAQAVSDLDGVESAEDLAGPYDVIARIRARSGSAGPAGGLRHPGRGRRHPHPHLHSDPPVATEAAATTATPPSRCGPGNAHRK